MKNKKTVHTALCLLVFVRNLLHQCERVTEKGMKGMFFHKNSEITEAAGLKKNNSYIVFLRHTSAVFHHRGCLCVVLVVVPDLPQTNLKPLTLICQTGFNCRQEQSYFLLSKALLESLSCVVNTFDWWLVVPWLEQHCLCSPGRGLRVSAAFSQLGDERVEAAKFVGQLFGFLLSFIPIWVSDGARVDVV